MHVCLHALKKTARKQLFPGRSRHICTTFASSHAACVVGNSRNQPHAASDRLLEPLLCETSSTSLTDLLYYSGVERCKLDSTSGSRHTKSAHCNQQLLSVAAHSYLALVSGTLMKEVTLLPCTLHSQSAETQDECICNEMLCPAAGQPHIRGTETEMTHFLPAS